VADARIDPVAKHHADQLKRYWAHGDGAARWTTFRELRVLLAAHGVPPKELDGETANIYHMRFGRWPGKKRGNKK
jgi:hypothetical protein